MLTGTGFTYVSTPDTSLVGGTITGISFELNGVHQGDLTTSLPVADIVDAITAEESGDTSAVETFFMSFNWTYHGNDSSEVTGLDVIGDDVPFNLAGNDVISLQGGDDVFFAGDGTDTINGGAGSDEIHGGSGADVLNGGDDDDVLVGDVGNDTINGGTGGDDFDDVWYGAEGGSLGVTVDLASGTATDTFGNTDTLISIEGMAGTDQNDVLRGNDRDNILRSLRGNDVVDGRGGSDEVHYGGDKNVLYVTVDLQAGTGIEHYSDGNTTDTLTSIERIRGSHGDDFLYGDNVIKGLAGNDTIDGRGGIDRVDYHNDVGPGGTLGVVVDIAGGTATDGFGDTDTLVNIEDARGTRFNDTITGDMGSNLLIGDDGDDTINGGGVASAEFHDSLDGGAGNDTLTIVGQGEAMGGEGNDRIIGETSGDADNIDNAEAVYFTSANGIVANLTATNRGGLAGGNTTTGFLVNDGLGGTDRLSGLHVITDTDFDDTIYVDETWTNSYGNWLEVRLGAGNDHVENDGAEVVRVSYARAGGAVTVNLATGTATDANPGDDFIGTDTLIGVNQARGSAFDDTIIGDGNDNQLRGRQGNDHLYGGGGNDVLYGEERSASPFVGNDYLDGGTGADQMFGGAGNDIYIVDNANDVVDESAAGSNGIDTVRSTLTINLSDAAHVRGAVENAVLTGSDAINVFGNTLANVLVGNAGNNTLNGLAGADTMRGMAGNDVYVVDNAGDIVDESVAGSGGMDWVVSSLTLNLSDGDHIRGAVENAQLTGSEAVNAFGNGLDNVIVGNAGNNTLNGMAGADTMRGMAGNDVYVVDNAGDVVDESVAGSAGTDWVLSSLSVNLTDAAHFLGAIENVQLTGAGNTSATGNGLANVLVGNAGNNLINGNAGADTMRGMAGNDVYIVDNAGDVVDESIAGSGGIDTINSVVSVNLSSANFLGAIENATLAGAANVNGYGNTLANVINGNGGANILNGLAGNDTLRGMGGNDRINGGTGNDTLVGGAGNDAFVFNTALQNTANVDTITDFSAPSDTIWLENAIFSALTATGTLAASAFHVGAAATTAAQHIIYNSANGWLSYDADGSGGGAAIHFATLTTQPTITNADFVVV